MRTVQKVGYFGPLSPDGQGDCGNHCVPIHRTARILTQSKNPDKAMFHAENARLLSKSAVFALQMYISRVVGGLQGGHGTPPHQQVLCACCADTPPCVRVCKVNIGRRGSPQGSAT